MRNHPIDFHLIIGFIIAHFLLFFSFQDQAIFWYIFSASLLLLIIYAIFNENVYDEASFFNYISLGTITGLLLYALFWLGFHSIELLHIPIHKSVSNLYRWFAPTFFWQYLALLLVAAPGEELFWRGFVQKRLIKYVGPLGSIFTGAFLYATVNIYSGTFTLVLSAFISGLYWGALYTWKKSMPLVIVSHLVFDILLFLISPLK